MPKIIQTINIDQEIAFSPQFKKMKEERRLSPFINEILRNELDLKVEKKEEEEIREELSELSIKSNILKSKLEEIKKQEEKAKQPISEIERQKMARDQYEQFKTARRDPRVL